MSRALTYVCANPRTMQPVLPLLFCEELAATIVPGLHLLTTVRTPDVAKLSVLL